MFLWGGSLCSTGSPLDWPLPPCPIQISPNKLKKTSTQIMSIYYRIVLTILDIKYIPASWPSIAISANKDIMKANPFCLPCVKIDIFRYIKFILTQNVWPLRSYLVSGVWFHSTATFCVSCWKTWNMSAFFNLRLMAFSYYRPNSLDWHTSFSEFNCAEPAPTTVG